MQYQVRPMLHSDVDAILQAQALAYPRFLLEGAGFFLNRLALAPRYCWVPYPWDAGLPPALDVPLTALPARADHWFLHDCAVVPAAQGMGVGQSLVGAAAASAMANGLTRASLVSLASATGYWTRHGYAPLSPQTPGLAEKLADYGEGASYMSRAFPFPAARPSHA